MLKSEAENMVRRVIEELGRDPYYEQQGMVDPSADPAAAAPAPAAPSAPVFNDQQVEALAQIVMKIAGRMIEESLSSWRPGVPGSKPNFFTD
jgi:hypothetical protein